MSEPIVLEVAGMTCGGCEQSVSNAVGRLPGVTGVRASHVERRVEVEGETDPAAVREAIEAAGFEVVG